MLARSGNNEVTLEGKRAASERAMPTAGKKAMLVKERTTAGRSGPSAAERADLQLVRKNIPNRRAEFPQMPFADRIVDVLVEASTVHQQAVDLPAVTEAGIHSAGYAVNRST